MECTNIVVVIGRQVQILQKIVSESIGDIPAIKLQAKELDSRYQFDCVRCKAASSNTMTQIQLRSL
jgi:hypothetical protein